MIEYRRVFLDLPRFEVSKEEDLESQRTLAKLERSERLTRWYNSGAKPEEQPISDLGAYPDLRRSRRKQTILMQAHRLAHEIHQGDLIVLPFRSSDEAFREIYVGEVAGSPSERTFQPVGNIYGGMPLPSRSVRWLGKRPAYQCSEALFRRVFIPNPLTTLEQSVRHEVFEIAYKNYSHNEEIIATFDVGAEDYNSRHELLLQLLINFAAKATEAAASEQPLPDVSIMELASGDIESIYLPELSLSINSPGSIIMQGAKVTALVAVVLFQVALSACDAAGGDPSSAVMPPPESIVIVGADDGEVPDECLLPVQETIRSTFRTMGADRFVEYCRMAHATREAEITTTVNVRDNPNER